MVGRPCMSRAASSLCWACRCAWACSTARQPAFAEAEQLPFTDPEEQALLRKALILGR